MHARVKEFCNSALSSTHTHTYIHPVNPGLQCSRRREGGEREEEGRGEREKKKGGGRERRRREGGEREEEGRGEKEKRVGKVRGSCGDSKKEKMKLIRQLCVCGSSLLHGVSNTFTVLH